MILVFHVVVALASIVFATATYMRPSSAKLHVTYGSIAATLATGTYLVVSSPAHMIQACITGVGYLVVVGAIALAARAKLAAGRPLA